MSTKLSEKLCINVTYEMVQWLDEIARQTGQARGAITRSILQAVMDDDAKAEQREAA